MSLFWGRRGDSWEPEGGERREWRDLQPGDLIVLRRKVWRVREVQPVPVADWDEDDRDRFRMANRGKVSEENWQSRPLYLIVLPARGGNRYHVKVRPWTGLGRTAYVLHPHYPVCVECGEPWPCPEIGITREVRAQAAEMERLASILPGCCWSCGEPVTARQSSIVFEGENLLLPGSPPPVFHLRAQNGCRPAAMTYEDRWVDAGEGRPWRLQCPGRLVRHVDGGECDRPDCPGERARHAVLLTHVVTEGGTAVRWAVKCTRCRDAVERGEGLPVAAVPENFPADIYRDSAVLQPETAALPGRPRQGARRWRSPPGTAGARRLSEEILQMSLYDLAVADGRQHERGAVLLGMLGSPVVARFRDAWVEKSEDGPVIAIYTRQGGGNRKCYCDAGATDPEHVPASCYAACNEALAAHPLYLRDSDDSFDATYSTFYFRAPEEWREVLAAVAGDPVDMSARWQEAIARVERGDIRPGLLAAGEQLAAALNDPSPDSPKIIKI